MSEHPDDYDLQGIDDYPEACGSCDECQANVYPGDFWEVDGLVLCDECAWAANQ